MSIRIKAGETPFAKDATFGYKSSNLQDWIVEKTGRSRCPIERHQIFSFDLAKVRQEGPNYMSKLLLERADHSKPVVFIVNAADEADMDVVILGILEGKSGSSEGLYMIS